MQPGDICVETISHKAYEAPKVKDTAATGSTGDL